MRIYVALHLNRVACRPSVEQKQKKISMVEIEETREKETCGHSGLRPANTRVEFPQILSLYARPRLIIGVDVYCLLDVVHNKLVYLVTTEMLYIFANISCGNNIYLLPFKPFKPFLPLPPGGPLGPEGPLSPGGPCGPESPTCPIGPARGNGHARSTTLLDPVRLLLLRIDLWFPDSR